MNKECCWNIYKCLEICRKNVFGENEGINWVDIILFYNVIWVFLLKFDSFKGKL